jgi:hypothetical protein
MTVRVEVKPAHAVGTIRVDETLDPETIIRMSAKDLDTFVRGCGVSTTEVCVHDDRFHARRKHTRTGGKAHHQATVPLSIAAAASLLQFENYQPALQRSMRLQPQNAGRFFAREKGKETIAESNEANADMALQLMSAWAGDIADAARHSGVEREARLNGGAEVFAAYLQKIEFAHHINHQEVKELEIIFQPNAFARSPSCRELYSRHAGPEACRRPRLCEPYLRSLWREEVWKALRDAKEEGWVHSIGVSGPVKLV